MSDIETEKFRQIAIDLINEYRQQRGIRLLDWLVIDTPETSAFIRSIQLHEKAKKELADCKQELSAFRQEVSDAVSAWHFNPGTWNVGKLMAFIIPAPKPDPLVEALLSAWPQYADRKDACSNDANALRAALDARGLEIREKNDD